MTRKNFSRSAAALVAVLAAVGPARGALVYFNGVDPDGTNQSGNTFPFAANAVDAGVTATGLTRFATSVASTGINVFGVDATATASHASAPYYRSTTFAAENNSVVDDGPGSIQQAEAISTDAYIFFTLSATSPGDVLNLTNFSMNISQGTGSANQERGFAVYSSLDGYTTALAADAAIDALRPNWTAVSVPLGAVQVPSVTFRLYLFVGDGAGIGSNIDFDDVLVDGTVVPVPEASTAAMLSVVAAAFGRMRRRRQID